ncbi:hypothetical protein AVEN_116997-1, partial [Araneus ventricosus]
EFYAWRRGYWRPFSTFLVRSLALASSYSKTLYKYTPWHSEVPCQFHHNCNNRCQTGETFEAGRERSMLREEDNILSNPVSERWDIASPK